MTFFGLDPTAGQMLFIGSTLVFLLGALAGVWLGCRTRTARFKALRAERDRLAVELGEANVRNEVLIAGSEIPKLQADLSTVKARAERLLDDKLRLLSERDQLQQRLTDARAEVMELKGQREDQAAQIEQLQQIVRTLGGQR